MATIDKKQGKIRDRTVGYKPMCYCVGNKSTKYLQSCLKAHETIMGVLAPQARESITPKEAKSAVLAYVALDDEGKKELLKKIALSGYGMKNEKPEVSLEQLADSWFEQKTAQGVTDKQRDMMHGQKTVMLDFFNSQGFKTTADLKPDTAHKFLSWRSGTNYSGRQTQISASTLKHNLQVLRQMAKVAARHGWMANATIWDDVKVKSIAGVNAKVVEPLSVDMQRSILERLKNMRHELHDSVLLLLLTGMRIGELEGLTPENIRQAIKRHSFAKEFKGIHPHRFRHTFAVNKLLSQTATLEMVKYQLGHSDISTTANDYGEFIPEHFKAGFEEAIKERRELVEWLENGYFL